MPRGPRADSVLHAPAAAGRRTSLGNPVSKPTDPATSPGAANRSASVWTSRARRVFEEVRALEGVERRAALDRACGDDWPLHAEVAALFAHDAPSPPSAERPSARMLTDAPRSSGGLAPDAIPGYRIVRLSGRRRGGHRLRGGAGEPAPRGGAEGVPGGAGPTNACAGASRTRPKSSRGCATLRSRRSSPSTGRRTTCPGSRWNWSRARRSTRGAGRGDAAARTRGAARDDRGGRRTRARLRRRPPRPQALEHPRDGRGRREGRRLRRGAHARSGAVRRARSTRRTATSSARSPT